jgi:hypothetical protein
MLHKTNPEYAQLAYRRTILVDVIKQIQRAYLPNDAMPEPQRKLLCDAVFGSDAEVPAEAFQAFLAELHTQAETISVEMTDFNFTRNTRSGNNTKQEPNATKSSEKPGKKGTRKSARTT